MASYISSTPALDRALLILEALARSRNGLTMSQLARDLSLPTSSVHLLLVTFMRRGYLYREANRRYRLGLRICDLANFVVKGIELGDQAMVFLYRLHHRTGLPVHMAVLDEVDGVVVKKLESAAGPHVNSWLGKRMGLHCTAAGKALLAQLRDEQVAAVISRRGMLRYNENTIVSMKRLRSELDEVRRVGYSLDSEEEEIGVRCIGAPVPGYGQELIAAISISAASVAFHPGNFDELAAEVKKTAREIVTAAANTAPYSALKPLTTNACLAASLNRFERPKEPARNLRRAGGVGR